MRQRYTNDGLGPILDGDVMNIGLSMMDALTGHEECVNDPKSFEGTLGQAQDAYRTAEAEYQNATPDERADKMSEMDAAKRRLGGLMERSNAIKANDAAPEGLSRDYLAGVYDAMVHGVTSAS